MSLNELKEAFKSINEPAYRAEQAYSWFYQKYVTDLDQMSNFSQKLRDKISQNFEIQLPEVFKVAESQSDGSQKFLLKTHDDKLIEAILMPTEKRTTLCVSCMIGCPLKCKFCATGSQIGFVRKLDQSEILGQVIQASRKERITNIVFMGMGEPLLNLKNVDQAIQILLNKDSFGISRSKVTLSTAGVTENLSNFINKYRINLAISLHFTTDEQRSEFMPINKKYSINELITELKKIELAKRDYITIEYIMIKDVNDSLDDARRLIKLLNGLKIKINLIPYNPTTSFVAQSSTEEQIDIFAKYLRSKSVMVTVRRSLGKETEGACGQFALKN